MIQDETEEGASSDVQCGHRFAAFATLNVQNGHGRELSVTGAGFA